MPGAPPPSVDWGPCPNILPDLLFLTTGPLLPYPPSLARIIPENLPWTERGSDGSGRIERYENGKTERGGIGRIEREGSGRKGIGCRGIGIMR